MDNKSFNKFLKVSFSAIVILSMAVMYFIYVVDYKENVVDISQSSKKDFKVELISIGEPEFSFGMTSGKIIRLNNDEFVIYKNILAKDEERIESTEILEFYMVNKSNMNIKNENKVSW